MIQEKKRTGLFFATFIPGSSPAGHPATSEPLRKGCAGADRCAGLGVMGKRGGPGSAASAASALE